MRKGAQRACGTISTCIGPWGGYPYGMPAGPERERRRRCGPGAAREGGGPAIIKWCAGGAGGPAGAELSQSPASTEAASWEAASCVENMGKWATAP